MLIVSFLLNDSMQDTDIKHVLSDVAFSELALHQNVLAGLDKAGFTHCTPIQAGTLPHALSGKDIAGQAQTGTGKTAAFLLVVYNRLLQHREAAESSEAGAEPLALGSLILAPTRELALQIHKDAVMLGLPDQLRIGLAYGGVDYEKQRNELAAGLDVLIGTPGRIIDYFKQGVFTLKQLQVLVLDEADRMFDLGFIKDIRYLLHRCPPPQKRQSLLFSATLSLRVTELAYEHMNNPEKVVIQSEQVTADNVEQSVYYPANEDKLGLLFSLLKAAPDARSIVFVNTKHIANRIASTLRANDIEVALLSGNVPQKRRERLLERFHNGDVNTLVATDVAARGLHIPAVSHVINFDLPQSAEDYVHRIGRTARLGARGQAISFACENYAFHLPEIESYIEHRLELQDYQPEDLPEMKPAPPQKQRPRPHGKGGRHSNSRRHSRGSRSRN